MFHHVYPLFIWPISTVLNLSHARLSINQVNVIHSKSLYTNIKLAAVKYIYIYILYNLRLSETVELLNLNY